MISTLEALGALLLALALIAFAATEMIALGIYPILVLGFAVRANQPRVRDGLLLLLIGVPIVLLVLGRLYPWYPVVADVLLLLASYRGREHEAATTSTLPANR